MAAAATGFSVIAIIIIFVIGAKIGLAFARCNFSGRI